MTTFTYPQDIIRISTHLGYDPTDPAYIVAKMHVLENLDVTWSNNPEIGEMNYVGTAISYLDELDQLKKLELDDIANDTSEIKRQESYLEGSEEYFESNHAYKRYRREQTLLGQLSKLLKVAVNTQTKTYRRHRIDDRFKTIEI